MIRATLRGLFARRLRLAHSAFAAVLGVAFVAGSLVLTTSLGASFDALFAGFDSDLDVQVSVDPARSAVGEAPGTATGTGGTQTGDDALPDSSDAAVLPVAAAVAARIAAAPGVRSATGVVWTPGVRVVGRDGKVAASLAPRAGLGWRDGYTLIDLRTGRPPRADGEVALDASMAKQLGYHVGDRVAILTLAPKRTFTVVGIFGYSGDRDTLGGSEAVAFALPVAQRLMLGGPDRFSAVDVVADDGTSADALRGELQRLLGPRYLVRTGKQAAQAQSSGVDQALGFFNYILLGFAGVAVFVGIFLILNTFSMLVAQRTGELALLRALGAGRGQVVRSVLLEALVIGLVAAVVGLAAGIGIGALLTWAFARYGGADLDVHLDVPARAVLAAFLVGLGVTLVAALIPAVRAAKVPPIAALREIGTPDKPLTEITALGAMATAAAVAALAWGLWAYDSTQWWALLAGVIGVFLAAALLTPILSRPLVSVLGRALSWSVPGRLGRQNSGRNPRRTAVTAAALMIGIALVTGVSTILASITTSIDAAVRSGVSAQLIVAGRQSGPVPPTFDARVLPAIARVPGVRAVAGFAADVAVVDGKPNLVTVTGSPAAAWQILHVHAVSGRIDVIPADGLLVDDITAARTHVNVGDTVEAQLPRGAPVRFRITGVYAQTAAVGGWIGPPGIVRSFRVAQPSQAFVQTRDGASVAAVRARVAALLVDSPDVAVLDRSAYITQTTGQFDTVLVMIQILLAMAILIAVLGIINTLALSVIERTREIGLLRAIGLGRSQTMRMITVESIVIAAFGALLGVLVGLLLGIVVTHALRDQGITRLGLPWGQIAVYLLLSGPIGVVAAVLPAVRAARLDVLDAISHE
jgi:putative ABC transport system permease protein